MGKATNNLDWLLEETETELEKFRLVWCRYEKWFCAKLQLKKDLRLTDSSLRHEWIITDAHITLIQDDWQHKPYVKMEISYYRAILNDIKISNEFRRTAEGRVLPQNKNKVAELLKRKGLWDYLKCYSETKQPQ